jgi:hypothetical protein
VQIGQMKYPHTAREAPAGQFHSIERELQPVRLDAKCISWGTSHRQ